MPPQTIDPKEFGRLEAKVDQMEKAIDKMATQMDELMALANRSKGGFWVGMSIASLLGGVVTFIAEKVLFK